MAVLDGAFLSPAQISPNFSVVFSLSTDDNTAFGECATHPSIKQGLVVHFPSFYLSSW